tara:strand:+ start:2785 stop:4083 length:1299 start_codon:yes stop_codon:yes gene_type:complete
MEQENSSSSDPSTIHIQVNSISTNNNEATIDNIHTEDSLLNDIYSIENNYLSGYDSPITMSLHGSNSNPDSYHNSDDEDKLELQDTSYNTMFYNKKTLSLEDISNMTQLNLLNVIQESNKKQKYKKLSLNDIERSVEKYYGPSFHYKYTTEVDFLTTYMKGQKNLYTQAKNNSQWKLNCLMIPSLLLTCGISIVNPFIGCDNDIHLAVLSGLNALVALLLSIINYSKLESSTQIYFFMANQYDKYETILEMTNSKLMLLEKDNDKKSLVLDRINEIEEKIVEMKESNQILLPESIKFLFPIISHINIFSFIKRVQNHRQTLLIELKNIKNELRFIEYKWKYDKCESTLDREKNRYDYLQKIKGELKNEINEFKCIFCHLDEIFISEIRNAENQLNYFGASFLCFWKYANNKQNLEANHPIIHKYFHFMFADD